MSSVKAVSENEPAQSSHIPQVDNLHVRGISRLITPAQIKEQFPAEDASIETTIQGRRTARAIIAGEDPRLLVVIGPCSIHDPQAAIDYAGRLLELSREISDRVYVIMRVYFEKPRTTIGWKGLINDPHLDDSCDIAHGIALARELLLKITSMGLPVASEFLDPIIPQYIADLVSWAAVGARTTESQTHREMSSGLSMPVGFKNGTDGSVQTAIDAMSASRSPHSFLGIDQDGFTSIVKTTGNPDCHLVLRGGRSGPNYDEKSVREATEKLRANHLPEAIMVDCSHANSGKNPERQPLVLEEIVRQRANGLRSVIGAMIESNIHPGNQKLNPGGKGLQYGVSVTDACIGWETTAEILRKI